MRAVILLAGKGRRIAKNINGEHKSMISIYGKPLLWYLVEALKLSGVDEIIPVIGYQAKEIKRYLLDNFGKQFKMSFVYNRMFAKANNLYSLYLARKFVLGKSFLIVNGDLAIAPQILKFIVNNDELSEIAIDDSKRVLPIDSPGTIIINRRIFDLGRHIKFEDNGGYAVGVYKFNQSLSKVFFDCAKNMLNEDKNAGFHDPLRLLFKDNEVMSCSTQGLPWSDIDCFEDSEKVKTVIKKCYLPSNYKNEDTKL